MKDFVCGCGEYKTSSAAPAGYSEGQTVRVIAPDLREALPFI